ncbi:tetratricopeptide repeat protein [Vibrio splendidus]
MKYILAQVLILLLIVGCSSINDELVTKERLLTKSGQSEQLIEFYKTNLVEVPSYKVKLIELYLDKKDKKSAELYISTYKKGDLDEPEVIFTLAKLEYLKQNYEASKNYLEEYLDEGGIKGEFFLLNGKILAQQKQYDLAVDSFETSKKNGASDREANNNIAVVKMLQGEHQQAMEILYGLFASNPNDEKVRSNLMLASTRANRPDVVLEVLKYSSNEQEAREKLAKLMKSVKPIAKKKPESKSKLVKVASKPKRKEVNKVEPSIVAKKNQQPVVQRSVLNINNLKPKTPSIYRIQVLATYKVIPSEYLNYLKGNYGKVYSYTHGLWKRYCIGEFDNINDAKSFLQNMDTKGAFVVDYTKKRYLEL